VRADSRQATQELKDAFQVFPGQMMTAASFNNRFNLLLDILFGADPATLREEVAVLMEERQSRAFTSELVSQS
jgi:hypothetical protein